jgi:hypothetical protein
MKKAGFFQAMMTQALTKHKHSRLLMKNVVVNKSLF